MAVLVMIDYNPVPDWFSLLSFVVVALTDSVAGGKILGTSHPRATSETRCCGLLEARLSQIRAVHGFLWRERNAGNVRRWRCGNGSPHRG